MKIYSAHNAGKLVVAEIFIRTLKNKIYKHMTAVSKNVYIDKLDNIVNEYNNILKKLMIKILNLKLVIMLEYQNTKTFSLKDILQIGLKKFL